MYCIVIQFRSTYDVYIFYTSNYKKKQIFYLFICLGSKASKSVTCA